ncbi:hypothetical protein FRB98_003805 [Tulasnella sp. 332]|nr:hypothetical protein FRB98_003805 [Tulasnella sp. 332]
MQDETAAEEAVAPSTDGNRPTHINGKASLASSSSSKSRKMPPTMNDEDPHALMIESLRNQNNELFAQVTELNSKLVKSYDRVSDLEDNVHVTQSSLRVSNSRIAQLETERQEHLSALDTGLLVERAHVTTELTRLMEKASEEASQRGQAESAKHEIERELDDLSATLFNQANTMVAEARYARAMSEKKAAACETSMKSAEEAVAQMQFQMQALIESKESSEREAERLRELMDKGKWVDRRRTISLQGVMTANLSRMLRLHVPYEEYQFFLSHLRMIRPAMNHAPAFSSLVSLPFLLRLTVEDSDTTLRLDQAPSLNWLTRRSIAAAVQQGQLQVEPMQTTQLLLEMAAYVTGPSPIGDVSCALCGKTILTNTGHLTPPPSHPMTATRSAIPSTAAAWATTSRFLRNSIGSATPTLSRSNTAPSTPTGVTSPSISGPPTIYIFRLSLPSPQKSQPYALCQSGWCLARLRTTCEMWRFVRKSVVDKVWEEEVARLSDEREAAAVPNGIASSTVKVAAPPVPARRNPVTRVGSFWEKGLGALGVDVSKSPTTTSTAPLPRELPLPPPPLPARSPSRRNAKTQPGEGNSATPLEALTLTPSDAKTDEGEETSTVIPNDEKKAPAASIVQESSSVEVPPPPYETKEAEGSTVDLNDDAKEPTASPPVRPASPIRRPMTPSSVALPISRPSTPTLRSTALPISRPSTPTPRSTTLPTSTTSSPNVPPPLPRRAARRPLPAPPGTTRTGTPSPRTSMVFSPQKDQGQSQDGSPSRPERGRDPKRSSLSHPVEGVLNMTSGEGSPLKKALELESPSPRPVTPVREKSPRPSTPTRATSRSSFATAPSSPTDTVIAIAPIGTVDDVSTIVDETVEKGTVEVAKEEPVVVQETPTAQAATVKPVIPAAIQPPPTAADPSTQEPPVDVKSTPIDDSSSKDEAATKPEPINTDSLPRADSPIDETIYLGDKSWEEKAWKELAKLRADMFWARMGSVSAGRDV